MSTSSASTHHRKDEDDGKNIGMVKGRVIEDSGQPRILSTMTTTNHEKSRQKNAPKPSLIAEQPHLLQSIPFKPDGSLD
ncbi:hypothetical protein Cni_G26574 [Canna indica]|uniref:Uncharacterized protein n=1 Tax=Canna indica TaxID=4628 RepID=A0AAQ3QM74_9LILI|nr:hypothetical protein Cni_G26574 [Canna indica]